MYYPKEPRTYYVYIMTNRSKTLYTGVTSTLEKRVWQHKNHVFEGFTSRYRIVRSCITKGSLGLAMLSHEKSKSRDGHGSRSWR